MIREFVEKKIIAPTTDGGAVSAGLFGILGLGIGAAVVAFKKKKD